MVDDVTRKLESTLKKMQRHMTRILSGRWLENASVRGGRLRFIGGVLRLDSGALLDLIGQWRLRGPGAITGDVFSEGKWTQVGPWDFTGDGDLAGDVDLSGNFNLIGEFKAGNILIKDGKIYVGIGGAQIVIDGATGKITAGNVVIDPSAAGGTIGFGSVRRIDAASGFLGIYDGSRFIVFNSSGVSINGGGGPTLTVGPAGLQGVPSIPLASAPPGSFVGAVVYDSNNALRRVV